MVRMNNTEGQHNDHTYALNNILYTWNLLKI